MSWNQIWEVCLFWEFLFNFSIIVKYMQLNFSTILKAPSLALIHSWSWTSVSHWLFYSIPLGAKIVLFPRNYCFGYADYFIYWHLTIFGGLVRYDGIRDYVCCNLSRDFFAFLNWVILLCMNIAPFSFPLSQKLLDSSHSLSVVTASCGQHWHIYVSLRPCFQFCWIRRLEFGS